MTGTRRQPARRVRPFTPSQESPAVLSDRTVGRESTLETMVARLVDAARSGNRAHTMLVGPRGSGKTHLLNVAVHRAKQLPDVERRMVFVRFDEDAIGVHRYRDILAETYARLAPAGGGSRRPTLSETPEADIAQALGDRVLVLAIENSDRIFKSLGKEGQQAFRAWVEQSQQILVVASTPSLFKGIQDRSLPWWGNFGVHHLQELDLDEGRELLIKLALESNDNDLAEFLATPKAEGRLRAINALAGGSPRVWMILSECLTVETLDELAPAVQALLEGLVPYYQQLLWDLSPVEQQLVRALADGPHHAATVQELAAACDIDQRVAASTLKRLADMRWVRADKSPELDRRHSWYRLREPLVRHHFQYRSATDQPLPLIVELLKAWYDPQERREQLIRALPGSETERLLAATLADFDTDWAATYASRDIAALRSDARSWLHGQDAARRTADAGVLIDVITGSAQDGSEATLAGLEQRNVVGWLKQSAVAIAARAAELHDQTAEEKIGKLLRFALANLDVGRTAYVLELISALWDSSVDCAMSVQRLQALLDQLEPMNYDLLDFDIRFAQVEALTTIGSLQAAARYLDALVDYLVTMGASEETELFYRFGAANLIGRTHKYAEARDRFQMIAQRSVDELGHSHLLSLEARLEAAICTGFLGEHAAACDQLRELAQNNSVVSGGHRPTSLRAHAWLAANTAAAGKPGQAIEQAWTTLAEPDLDAENVKLLRWVVGDSFAQLMELATVPAGWREGGLIPTLQAAAAGEEEAFMRLPGELADIVRAARAQNAGQKAESASSTP